MALIAYLAAASPAGYRRRDELLAIFWPELDSTRGRRALSQALHVIRSSLEDGAISTRGVEELGLNPDVIVSDVADFRAAFQAGNWEVASSQYQGDLLAGFFIPGSTEFDQWLDKERATLRRQAGDCLWHLSDAAESGNNIDKARDWARRATELDPHDEEGLRRYMRLLARTGNPAQAINAYDDYRARIARELELEPATDTRELADSLRARETRRDIASPRVVVPDVPTGEAGESNASDIPLSAAAEPAGQDINKSSSRRLVLVGVPLLLVAFAVAAFIRARASTSPTTNDASASTYRPTNNRIIVADFTSAPADSALARTVTDIIKLDLSRSNLVQVLSDAKARDALMLMRRDTGTRMIPEVAREAAIREGVKAVLQGDVRHAGGAITLTARLVSADDGMITGGWHSAAKDSAEIVQAINNLSSAVRQDAGESMNAIAASSPILLVSTESLPALRKHAMGMAAFYDEDFARATALFEEAIAIDTTFVDAYMMLGVSLAQSGAQQSRQVEAMIKAYQYRNRLREAERYNVEAMYLSDVKGDIPGAIAAAYNAAASDPSIVFWGRLSVQLARERRFAEAEAVAKKGLRWTPYAILYRIYAYEQYRNGKAAEALHTMDSASRLFPRSLSFAIQKIDFAEAMGQYRVADSLAHALPGPRANVAALSYQGFADALLGKVDEAKSHFVEVRRLQSTGGRIDPTMRATMLLARLDLELANDTLGAIAVLDSGIANTSWRSLDPRDRPYLSTAHFLLTANKVDRAAQLLAEYERVIPPNFRAKEQWLRRRTQGMLKVARGDASGAEAIATDAYTDPAPMAALADLVWAYRKLGHQQDAEKAAIGYLNEGTALRLEDDAFNLANILRFLEESAKASGRTKPAAAYHARVAQLWTNADKKLKDRLQ